MPSRRPPSPAGSGGKEQSLQRKLADLVARRSYSQAIRLREQALRHQPELELQPCEAQLWCLEGRQALKERQPKRAETALATAMAVGLHGEPLYLLARLRLDQGQPEQALERDAPGEAIRCWRPIVDRPAFDPDLALRLYPLLDKGDSDDSQEAERLAPDLPDVTGCRGMLALVAGEATTAIPLLWQALQGGCRSSHVYELLDEALDSCGQETERRRLEREHGPRFGVTPRPGLEQGGMAPAWLDALSRPDVLSSPTTAATWSWRSSGWAMSCGFAQLADRSAVPSRLWPVFPRISWPLAAAIRSRPSGRGCEPATAITAAELEFGVIASGVDAERNREALEQFLLEVSAPGIPRELGLDCQVQASH